MMIKAIKAGILCAVVVWGAYALTLSVRSHRQKAASCERARQHVSICLADCYSDATIARRDKSDETLDRLFDLSAASPEDKVIDAQIDWHIENDPDLHCSQHDEVEDCQILADELAHDDERGR
jgi:hypothetical protein